ncbi:MAG TPA: hypothetical protein VGK10_18240 [Prolixibacteraceae bacterium]|jgi:hypothetical protein
MEENIYLLIGLIITTIVFFVPDSGKGVKINETLKSELNARDRYAVADMIDQELAEDQSPLFLNGWTDIQESRIQGIL